MGFCGKLKRAEQRKLKQWYGNGLLQKVEKVLLKWAEQGKLTQWYGNGLLWKIETGRAGELKTMVWKWAVAES